MEAMLAGHKVDAVLNSFSHDAYIPTSLRFLQQGGHFLEIGKRDIWTTDQMAQARPDVLYHVIAVDSRMSETPAWLHGVLALGVERVNQGILTPLPRTEFELQRHGVEAFRFLQHAGQIGKVVVTIQSHVLELDGSCSYVISGGTGALGLQVGQWLVKRGVRRVVLLSRSGSVATGAEGHWEWLQR